MNIIINPGSGPVEDATREHAEANMRQFLVDLGLPGVVWATIAAAEQGDWRLDPAVDDGRYGFRLEYAGHSTEVAMPGLPLEQVRYLDGDPWPFPRLYVDGGSWLWKWALSVARRALGQEEED